MGLILWVNYHGKAVEMAKARKDINSKNFIIRINGMDWSGYRTLENCLIQFLKLCEDNPQKYFTLEED